jgi:putative DNA primase/helicase
VIEALTDGRSGVFDVACPVCGPSRRSARNRLRPVLRVWRGDAAFASFTCARCGFRGWTRVSPMDAPRRRAARILPPPRPAPEAADRSALALKLWHAAGAVRGTLGWRYLTERRGLALDGIDVSHALRWDEGRRMLLALMTDAVTGAACGIHRTFLDADGVKRERRMLGRQGVIRLSPDDAVTLGLGIAEGLEDGLAVLAAGWRPVWSAGSAGGIARFPVLPGIDHLTILADADAAGMSAATAAAGRWRAAGRQALVVAPDTAP